MAPRVGVQLTKPGYNCGAHELVFSYAPHPEDGSPRSCRGSCVGNERHSWYQIHASTTSINGTRSRENGLYSRGRRGSSGGCQKRHKVPEKVAAEAGRVAAA